MPVNVPYATPADVSELLNEAGLDAFAQMAQGSELRINGTKKKITRGALGKLLEIYRNLGMKSKTPQEKVLEAMLLSPAWASGRGGGVVNYRGVKGKKLTISKMGTINLRVGANENGKGGFFEKGSGKSVNVDYSSDGKTITITE